MCGSWRVDGVSCCGWLDHRIRVNICPENKSNYIHSKQQPFRYQREDDTPKSNLEKSRRLALHKPSKINPVVIKTYQRTDITEAANVVGNSVCYTVAEMLFSLLYPNDHYELIA